MVRDALFALKTHYGVIQIENVRVAKEAKLLSMEPVNALRKNSGIQRTVLTASSLNISILPNKNVSFVKINKFTTLLENNVSIVHKKIHILMVLNAQLVVKAFISTQQQKIVSLAL
jgi:hypothetical protein